MSAQLVLTDAEMEALQNSAAVAKGYMREWVPDAVESAALSTACAKFSMHLNRKSRRRPK